MSARCRPLPKPRLLCPSWANKLETTPKQTCQKISKTISKLVGYINVIEQLEGWKGNILVEKNENINTKGSNHSNEITVTPLRLVSDAALASGVGSGGFKGDGLTDLLGNGHRKKHEKPSKGHGKHHTPLQAVCTQELD